MSAIRSATSADYARFLVLAHLALMARPSAVDGAPLTVGGAVVRREAARPSETPAGVALHAPAGLVAGGDLAIAYTVSPNPQNGRGRHETLI